MKNYTITVNGTAYEVSVDENIGGTQVASPVVHTQAPVVAKPAAAQLVAAAKAVVSSAAGANKVNSPMPGKILAVKASAGQVLKRGEVIVVLEAMKMENEIVAPQDGTLVSINVTVGQNVEAGDLLATLN